MRGMRAALGTGKDPRVRTSGAPPAKGTGSARCGWHLRRRGASPGGRLLRRACRSAAVVPDDTGPAVIERVFRDSRTDQIYAQDIPSGNQPLPAIAARPHL